MDKNNFPALNLQSIESFTTDNWKEPLFRMLFKFFITALTYE